jgi:hypothetical protein
MTNGRGNKPMLTDQASPPKLSTSSSLTIQKALLEAWLLVSGLKLTFCLVSIITLACYLVSTTAVILLIFTKFETLSIILVILFILAELIKWYSNAICTIVGVNKATEETISLKIAILSCMRVKMKLFILWFFYIAIACIFAFLNYFSMKFFTVLFCSILIKIILFALYLYFVLPITCFAVPLIVKGHNVKYALQKAEHMFEKCYINMILSYMIICIFLVISNFLLGIPLIWTIPMHYTLIGVWFRDALKVSAINPLISEHP